MNNVELELYKIENEKLKNDLKFLADQIIPLQELDLTKPLDIVLANIKHGILIGFSKSVVEKLKNEEGEK